MLTKTEKQLNKKYKAAKARALKTLRLIPPDITRDAAVRALVPNDARVCLLGNTVQSLLLHQAGVELAASSISIYDDETLVPYDLEFNEALSAEFGEFDPPKVCKKVFGGKLSDWRFVYRGVCNKTFYTGDMTRFGPAEAIEAAYLQRVLECSVRA